jgi:GT2 family glycosyltransferase
VQLSVIIVNYNVRHFLEQALLSVRRAMQGIEGEVWVVDNHSVDDSVRMVQEKFPEVQLIANTDNTGFAVANNQAIRQSQGRYVLLLNPDTLVEEDTFRYCLDFMEAHPEAGAAGVRLIDGSGAFLPESRRGFPTPWVSFCKTVGLSTLFPRSRWFNGYYLGYLPDHEEHPIDVLVGAFMFIRREALDKAGLLDEAFFMYGEDIDLSYRIVQAGYQNYYLPGRSIIHYKGESTKKGSLNYVRTFYQAMIIFVRKHFQGRQAFLFITMLQAAIWLRAGLTLFSNFWRKIWLPSSDSVLIFSGLVLLKNFWAGYYYDDPQYFKASVLWFNFPLYTVAWVTTVWLSGGYDGRYEFRRLIRGLVTGTVMLAAVYGLLDLGYRPSRVLLLLGALWALVATVGLRLLLHLLEFSNLNIGSNRIANLVIVGSAAECARVQELLRQSGIQKNMIGLVSPDPAESSLGAGLNDLGEVVRVYRVNELIFCSKDLPARDILTWMTRLGPQISYKIVPEESLSIIGSSNRNEPGELYTIDIRYNIAEARQRRNKRVFDLTICLFLLVAAPFWLLLSPRRGVLLRHWLPVLLGRYTWVGYAPNPDNSPLPYLRSGVFSPVNAFRTAPVQDAMIARLNFLYAKDWQVWRDIEVLGRVLFRTGVV